MLTLSALQDVVNFISILFLVAPCQSGAFYETGASLHKVLPCPFHNAIATTTIISTFHKVFVCLFDNANAKPERQPDTHSTIYAGVIVSGDQSLIMATTTSTTTTAAAGLGKPIK